MQNQTVKIPDPISAQPKSAKMGFKKQAIIILIVGFLAGWAWMTWAMVISPPIGLDGIPFWRLLLPF